MEALLALKDVVFFMYDFWVQFDFFLLHTTREN